WRIAIRLLERRQSPSGPRRAPVARERLGQAWGGPDYRHRLDPPSLVANLRSAAHCRSDFDLRTSPGRIPLGSLFTLFELPGRAGMAAPMNPPANSSRIRTARLYGRVPTNVIPNPWKVRRGMTLQLSACSAWLAHIEVILLRGRTCSWRASSMIDREERA